MKPAGEGRYELCESSAITTCLHGPAAYMAYGAFCSYLNEGKHGKSELESMYLILNAQFLFNDPEVIETIARLKPELCASAPSETFFERAVNMARALIARDEWESRRVRKLAIMLFTVFYCSIDFEHALAFIESIDGANHLPLCAFSVQTYLPAAIDMAEKCEQICNRYDDFPRIKLFAKSCRLAHLMRGGSREEREQYLDELLSDKASMKYPEYWWFVKQRTFFLSSTDAVPELERAVEKMRAYGSSQMQAYCEITLASNLALSGHAKKAEILLLSGLERCAENHCRPAVYYNNLAACHYLDRHICSEDSDALERALTYPITPFERTLVLANGYVVALALGQGATASKLKEVLKSTYDASYSSLAPRRIYASSMLLGALLNENDQEIDRYRRMLLDLIPEASEDQRPLMKVQATLETSLFDTADLLIDAYGYRPGFIGYWQPPFEREYIDMLANA